MVERRVLSSGVEARAEALLSRFFVQQWGHDGAVSRRGAGGKRPLTLTKCGLIP